MGIGLRGLGLTFPMERDYTFGLRRVLSINRMPTFMDANVFVEDPQLTGVQDQFYDAARNKRVLTALKQYGELIYSNPSTMVTDFVFDETRSVFMCRVQHLVYGQDEVFSFLEALGKRAKVTEGYLKGFASRPRARVHLRSLEKSLIRNGYYSETEKSMSLADADLVAVALWAYPSRIVSNDRDVLRGVHMASTRKGILREIAPELVPKGRKAKPTVFYRNQSVESDYKPTDFDFWRKGTPVWERI